jgi:hypothetical protein
LASGDTHNDSDADMRFIDVAPDGRFLMIEPEPSAQSSIDAELLTLRPPFIVYA